MYLKMSNPVILIKENVRAGPHSHVGRHNLPFCAILSRKKMIERKKQKQEELLCELSHTHTHPRGARKTTK